MGQTGGKDHKSGCYQRNHFRNGGDSSHPSKNCLGDEGGVRPATRLRPPCDRSWKQSELQSPTVLHIVNSKLEPELYYEFDRWMRHDHPAEELSVNRIMEFLRAETEAREQIAPTKITRPDAKWKPSVNHFTVVISSRAGVHQRTSTNLVYSDPCSLGC